MKPPQGSCKPRHSWLFKLTKHLQISSNILDHMLLSSVWEAIAYSVMDDIVIKDLLSLTVY